MVRGGVEAGVVVADVCGVLDSDLGALDLDLEDFLDDLDLELSLDRLLGLVGSPIRSANVASNHRHRWVLLLSLSSVSRDTIACEMKH